MLTLLQSNFLLLTFASRGHRATTTVEIPPRGRKSPFTSAHTGFAQRTTSTSTWFTIFSWKMPRLRYDCKYSFSDFNSRQRRFGW